MHGVRGEQARPGELRNSQVWIGKSNSYIGDADYIPPPPDEMEKALNELERYINPNSDYSDLEDTLTSAPAKIKLDYPKLIRIGIIHYQFEAIHPFHDGNGRIGRLLIILCNYTAT
jgi:Fic family protein